MSVDRFKVELNELLRRFSSMDFDKNRSPIAAPLTNREIIEAVEEVFSSKLKVNLADSMTVQAVTPDASGIVVTIPDAPDIPKQNVGHNGGIAGRNRSLDTLTAENLTDPSVDKPIIAELGSLALRVKDSINVTAIDVPDTRVAQRKLMSKSSPEVSTLIRSNTFVRQNAQETVENFDPITINGGSEYLMQNMTEILKKLQILRDSATDVVKKIDDIHVGVPEKSRPIRSLSAADCFPGLNRTSVTGGTIQEDQEKKIDDRNQDAPVNCRPIRRLSAVGCHPGLNRASMTGKMLQRPKMTRRSMLAAFPGTPTSSRLSPDESKAKDVSLVTGKSTSTIPVRNIEDTKLSIPPTYRSVSSGALKLSRKSVTRYDSPTDGSPASGIGSQKKPTSRSPSLSSLNLKNRLGGQQTKMRMYPPSQIPKEGIGFAKRKAY